MCPDSESWGLIGIWGPALTFPSPSPSPQYIVLLFLIVILEIVAGILGFVFQDDVIVASESRAASAINDFLPEDNDDVRSDVNSIVNFLQNQVCVAHTCVAHTCVCVCVCVCVCACIHIFPCTSCNSSLLLTFLFVCVFVFSLTAVASRAHHSGWTQTFSTSP